MGVVVVVVIVLHNRVKCVLYVKWFTVESLGSTVLPSHCNKHHVTAEHIVVGHDK